MSNTNKDSKQNIFKHTLHFSSASLVSAAFGLIRSLIIPFLFVPVQMGIWNIMNAVTIYSANAHLGIIHGMNKLIPMLRGQEKFTEIDKLKNSIFWVNFFLSGLACIIILIISFFISGRYLVYLWITGFIVFFQLIFTFQLSLLRANSSFPLLSKGIIILSVFSTFFIFTLGLLFYDHLFGAMLGLLLANICVTSYWFIKSKYQFPFQINYSSIRQSFVMGFPLIILGLLDVAFRSIDRWLVVANMGITMLGYYSLGIIVCNIICLIPVSISSIIYPKMLERFAAKQDYSSSSNLLIGALLVSAIGMLILTCGLSLFLPFLIKFFLPKYLPSVIIVKIFIFGTFFFSLRSIAGNYLVSVHKQRALITIQSIMIGILIFFYYLVLNLNYGIIAITLVTSVGYSICGIVFIASGIFVVNGRSYLKMLRFMVGLIIPFVIMLILVICLDFIIVKDQTLMMSLLYSVLGFIVISCFVTLATWYLNRNNDVIHLLQKELKCFFEAILFKINIASGRE